MLLVKQKSNYINFRWNKLDEKKNSKTKENCFKPIEKCIKTFLEAGVELVLPFNEKQKNDKKKVLYQLDFFL